MSGEIGIFDRADAENAGEMFDLFRVRLGCRSMMHFARFIDCFSEKIDQFFCLAGAGFEFFPIRAKNEAKSNMFRLLFMDRASLFFPRRQKSFGNEATVRSR